MIVAIVGSLRNTAFGGSTALWSGTDVYRIEVARLDVASFGRSALCLT